MSDDYREITQGDIGSDEGNSSDHIAELETEDFVWEDYLEEIGRFENLSVDICIERVVLIFSLSLQLYHGETPPKQSFQQFRFRLQTTQFGFGRKVYRGCLRGHRSHPLAMGGAKICGIRQRRDWLFNAKNCLKLITAGH